MKEYMLIAIEEIWPVSGSNWAIEIRSLKCKYSYLKAQLIENKLNLTQVHVITIVKHSKVYC